MDVALLNESTEAIKQKEKQYWRPLTFLEMCGSLNGFVYLFLRGKHCGIYHLL